MKKSELKAIADTYGMEIGRNPVTREAFCVYGKYEKEIPELTKICNEDTFPVVGTVNYAPGSILYKLVCPTSWFDLWGWK